MTALNLSAVQASPWDGFRLEAIDVQVAAGQVLGVIGPTRMDYKDVIPVVDITARLLSAAMRRS